MMNRESEPSSLYIGSEQVCLSSRMIHPPMTEAKVFVSISLVICPRLEKNQYSPVCSRLYFNIRYFVDTLNCRSNLCSNGKIVLYVCTIIS